MTHLKHIFSAANSPRLQIAAVAVALILALIALFSHQLANLYEVTAFNLAPDAQKAFDLGEKHFTSWNGAQYNVDLAEYYYTKAQQLDPNLLNVNHELARIAFIRGNLVEALTLIDKQINEHGSETPNSYYVRGLILGYMGRYDQAAKDYKHFLGANPSGWAGLNDYAWVLIKAKRYDEAAGVAAYGLQAAPDNPWLLNSYAIASSELGHQDTALEAITKASVAVNSVTQDQWLNAYPGNDPKIADQGIATLMRSISDNMQSIAAASKKQAE